jgi:EmrB/QacA subfamily drug resistance transporter
MTSTATLQTPVPPAEPRRMSAPALVAALVAVTLPVMSFFSVNVALGAIGTDLDASPAKLQLVVAGYGVVYASLVVIGGRLGDSFGRRRMILIGLAAFAATSLLCSLAQSSEQLIGARLLQGVAAALTTPQVLATIHASTDGHHRSRAIAWFGATAGIATSLAFLVGGSLTSADADWLGWRSVFWLNVPVALAVIVAVLRWMPETKAPARTSLDFVGAGLLAVAMTLLIGPVTEGRAVGWPTWTWIMLAVFVPVAATFIWWQWRLERVDGLPLVPPSLFRIRSMAVGLAIAAPFFVAFGGFMFVYALAAQVAGMTPLRIGLSLLPMSITFLIASLMAGRLVPRFGAKVLMIGALIGAVGYAGVAMTVSEQGRLFTVLEVTPTMAIAGFGLGLVMPPLFGIVLSQVPPHAGGLGTGVLITTQQMFLGLGSALVGSLYLSLVSTHSSPSAFARTVTPMVVVMIVIAGLTRLLESRPARA